MAVQTTPEVEVIGVNQLDPEQRKRRRRRNRKVVSDDSSADSSSCPSRRCRRQRKNKNNQQKTDVELSLEEQAQYIALDCEMVGIGRKGMKSSVAQVTLVGWNGEVIFQEFVKQEQEVTDYRTFVSGVTKDDLETAKLSFAECQAQVLSLIEGKVLVGHALKNDLKALQISHPWFMTRDTAKYEPFMHVRFNDGVLWPRKLKELVQEKLKREIQVSGKPHSAFEDAFAAMDLYRSVRRKWEKVMEYKFQKTQEIEMRNQANE